MTDASSVFPAKITQLRGHNVIAVASGKGGVGKTWFSITLTHALTKLGRNALLFDGDLGLANVDIQLGLMPKRDLGAVVDGRYSLQAAAERFPDGGFDIIAGRSGSGNLANLTVARLNELRNDADVRRPQLRCRRDRLRGRRGPLRCASFPARPASRWW